MKFIQIPAYFTQTVDIFNEFSLFRTSDYLVQRR